MVRDSAIAADRPSSISLMTYRETAPSGINDAHAARDAAIALHMQGRLSDAELLYAQSLRRAAQDFQTLFMYGLLNLQTGRLERAAKLLRRAIAIDPNVPAAHCNLGTVRAQQGRCEQALVSFERAIELEPRYAEAHGNLGVMLFNLNRFEQALASYDRAIHLQPDAATLHSNKGNVLQKLQRYEEALASFDTSITLAPEHAELHNNRGQCLTQMGRHEEAISSFDSSIRLGPESPEAHYSKGLALLTLGDLKGGWPLYEWRSNSARMMPTRAPAMPCPRWRGESDILGKTLFIHWEQGFGDTIQFCRYAKRAHESGAHVMLEVQPPLASLLGCLGPSIEIVTDLDRVTHADYYCPMMSLPMAFGTDLTTIPLPGRYLNSEGSKMQQWRSELRPSRAPLVGLA
jgi:tetratricopeptide (TPR) repeat protein